MIILTEVRSWLSTVFVCDSVWKKRINQADSYVVEETGDNKQINDERKKNK